MNKLILVLLTIVGTGWSMAQETYEVETPEGAVEAKKTTVDEFPQEVSEIEGSVLEAIEANALLGPVFVREFVAGNSDPNLKDYDEAFRQWQVEAMNGDTDIANGTVVDIFGSVLGEFLVSNLDMKWIRVTDQYGTEYAVKGKTSEVFAYPFSTVGKRVDRDEYDFMYNVFHAIKQSLESREYPEKKNEND